MGFPVSCCMVMVISSTVQFIGESDSDTPKMVLFDRKSDCGKPRFLFDFPSNHTSSRLHRLVSEIFTYDRQMDNADHYYSWPPTLKLITDCSFNIKRELCRLTGTVQFHRRKTELLCNILVSHCPCLIQLQTFTKSPFNV